jgi:hypothetical protein
MGKFPKRAEISVGEKNLVKPPFSSNCRHPAESMENIKSKSVSHLPAETAILKIRRSNNQPAGNQVPSSLQRLPWNRQV